MRRVFKYFLQGLVSVVPITVTLYLIYKAFVIIDNLIPVNVPGMGLLIILSGVTLIGMAVNHLVSDSLLAAIERQVKRAPLISLIYTAVKDLTQAFVGKKKSFSRPVMVKLSENSELRRLGFITNDNFEKLQDDCDYLTVYIPHSYNISGNMFLVPRHCIQPIKTNAPDFMKYAVSAGVTDLGEITILPPLNDTK
jgi:uncharacterized membrane protein